MKGWKFSASPTSKEGSTFDKLFRIFKELLLYTSGDVPEALSWLTELDKEYNLTTRDYGIANFVEDLMQKGYVQKKVQEFTGASLHPSSKMELVLRKSALEDIFGQLKKSNPGRHSTKFSGRGDEYTSEIRPFQFGDNLNKIALSETLKNAYVNHGIDDFKLTQDDLRVHETFYQSRMSTVLMIDISHSMILYGEDRITPAKKVALALAELIQTRYPKDTLDVVVFGNDAWQVELKDLPYLKVGPYHTNTVAGLELAMDILRKRRNANRQIFMITDGKPSCIKKGKKYYKNSWGLDRKIVSRTLSLAQKCNRLNIPVTTFMIASDPNLMRFVDKFTKINRGRAFYSSLEGLGKFIFADYKGNRKKRI